MKRNPRLTGKEAEELVASYLIEKGFKIIARNFRARNCEVDLVVSRENDLVFVEIKTCNGADFDFFGRKIDRKKQEKLITCAKLFCVKNSGSLNRIKSIRFDVVFVDLMRGEIDHYEGAFFADNELISF